MHRSGPETRFKKNALPDDSPFNTPLAGFPRHRKAHTIGGVNAVRGPLPSIRILLANHQPIVRSGLRFLLEHQPGFRVVAEAATGREAMALAEFSHPDIALLEVKLPQMNGITVARQLSSRERSPKLLFVTTDTDEAYVTEAFKAGARGYVSADSATADLPRAIHVLTRERFFLSPAICSQFLESHVNRGSMSEPDRELCCLLAAGYEEDEIADLLNAGVERGKGEAVYRQSMKDLIRPLGEALAGVPVLREFLQTLASKTKTPSGEPKGELF